MFAGALDISAEHIAFLIDALGKALEYPVWQEEQAANCWSAKLITGNARMTFWGNGRVFSRKMLRALGLVDV